MISTISNNLNIYFLFSRKKSKTIVANDFGGWAGNDDIAPYILASLEDLRKKACFSEPLIHH